MFNPDNRCFYINCANREHILELDENFKVKRTLSLADKYQHSGEAAHHTYDNIAIGNSLYVTMFSSTGNCKEDVFGECIAKFDLNSGKRLTDPVRELYMPHNVKMYGGGLHVLDSLPGHLRFNNMSIKETLSAFSRGLDYAFGMYIVGQSKIRNYSKVIGISTNISIDCGVVVFNAESKVSRSIPLTYETDELHAIVVEK